MLTPQQIKRILQENNIAVLKKFGQNFLISETVLNKIIETADIKPTDTVLEIGPGLGVLTFELAKKAKQVIAVEKDRKMAEILQKNLAEENISNVEVINQDALAFESCRYLIFRAPQNQIPTAFKNRISPARAPQNYKLISNLPYNIATAIIMKFLDPAFAEATAGKPEKIVVMIQKEVAQRITAVPPHMNKLAIFCQLYSTPKIIDIVPPSAFYPKPKVDSTILQLIPKVVDIGFQGLPEIRYQQPTTLTDLINLGFSHPRKTLLNNLASYSAPSAVTLPKEKISQWLLQNNINPNQRAESLSPEQWQILAKQYPQAN